MTRAGIHFVVSPSMYPILASFTVDAPAAAESYGISSVKVKFRLVSPGTATL